MGSSSTAPARPSPGKNTQEIQEAGSASCIPGCFFPGALTARTRPPAANRRSP